jgi:outer membrane protein TolC
MRQNGLKTQADESRFKASWLEAQDLLHSKRTEYRKSLYALEHLIDKRVESIDGNELDRAVEEKQIPSIESMQQELHQKNPELKRLEAVLAQAEANYNVSKTQGYGTLSAVVGYGVDRSLSSYDSSYVGLKGNLPLFDGGYLDAQMQKSALSVQIAQQEYENTKKQLFEELFNAASDHEQAIQSIEAKRGLIDALEQTLHLMEGRYTQGLATYVDVLEAQNALDNAKNGLSGAKLTKIVRFARIERLLNKGCIDEICR